MDPTTIADRAVLLLPSLTRILQKLEEKDLIVRARDDQDGRRQVISATAAGCQLIADNIPAAKDYAQKLKAHLGDDRYEQLLELLGDLNKIEL